MDKMVIRNWFAILAYACIRWKSGGKEVSKIAWKSRETSRAVQLPSHYTRTLRESARITSKTIFYELWWFWWRVIRPSPHALQIFKTKEVIISTFNRYIANTRGWRIINPNIRKQRSTFWCLYIPRFADSLGLSCSWHLVVRRFYYYPPTLFTTTTTTRPRRWMRREVAWWWRDPAQEATSISSTNSMITRSAGCVFTWSKKVAGFVGRGDTTVPGAFLVLVLVGVLVVLVTTCTPCCCCWCATTLFSLSESCSTYIGFFHSKKQTHSVELMKHWQLIHDKVIENNMIREICLIVFFCVRLSIISIWFAQFVRTEYLRNV